MFPTLLNCVASTFAGNGLPSYLSSAGFGSKVSTWLGPPSMNSTMTDLALGAKCGFFARRISRRVFIFRASFIGKQCCECGEAEAVRGAV